jgi:predicted O-methyltransferase YrrM
MDKTKDKSLEVLLELFKKRIDLQDAYPEVSSGDYQALINWAAGVSSKKWKDEDYDKISRYSNWYLQKQAKVERPKNEALVREILKNSEKEMDKTLVEVIKGSDISEHLTTLFFLVVEFNLKRILELGVRGGISSITLNEAASKIGGHVHSIDIDRCEPAENKLKKLQLDQNWIFQQGDDIEIGEKWNKELDFIFIDTSHSYNHTLKELEIFEPFLVSNGFITFHDTREFPGVLRAIKDFVNGSESKFHFYNYFNNNGFAILRKLPK